MPSPGFLDGVRSFVGALRFVAGRPRNWPLASLPMLVFVLLASCVTVSVVSLARGTLPGLLGFAPDGVILGIATVLMSPAALLAGVLVGLALAQPISGFALETLCRRQEAALDAPRHPDHPWALAALRSTVGAVAALAIAAVVLVPLTLTGWLYPPAGVVTIPLKMVATAFFVAWDLLDTPMSLRGMTVGDRWRWMRSNLLACFGFGLAASALLVVPVLGLLILPVGAVGASRLMVLEESHRG